MKEFLAQLSIQREVPACVVAQHLDGEAIGLPVQVLEETDAQKKNRFDSDTSVIQAIAAFQFRAGRHQPRVNELGEETIAIGLTEKTGGNCRRGKEIGLSGEVGQAHRQNGRECITLELPYG